MAAQCKISQFDEIAEGTRFVCFSSRSRPPAFRSLLGSACPVLSRYGRTCFASRTLNQQTTRLLQNQLFRRPKPPAGPEEENEVIALLFPCVLRPVFRFPCQRFRRLGCTVLFCSGWFRPCAFHCLVLASLLGWRSFAPWLFPLSTWALLSLFCFIVYLASSRSLMWLF